MKYTYAKKRGFTIVELLVVIVIIGILAAISIVAYNGVTAKARDAQRLQDVKTITKALELYYIDNGHYPNSSCGSSCPVPKKMNNTWSTTADGSWSVLEQALVPKYLSALPKDPQASLSTPMAASGGYNYDYVRWAGCTTYSSMQTIYLLAYKLESQPQQRDVTGQCLSGTMVTSGGFSVRIVINP